MKINKNKLQCEEDRTKNGNFYSHTYMNTLLGITDNIVSITINVNRQTLNKVGIQYLR